MDAQHGATDNNSLLSFVSQVSGDTYIKVEESFEGGYVRLNISEAERRQAKHDIRSVEDIVIEMLRNSRDANASRIFVATTTDRDIRTLTLIDDGDGVPTSMHGLIFEPRVTSKLETVHTDQWGVHGRGMALYSIKQNVESIKLVSSDNHKGSAFLVSVNTQELKERSDQSTWPKIKKVSADAFAVESGPKHILRHVIEFGLHHPNLEIYFGSPAEVAATLFSLGRGQRSAQSSQHQVNLDTLPFWRRLGGAYDAADVEDLAAEVGLIISERTAHRIIRGEVTPLKSIKSLVSQQFAPQEVGADIYKDVRGLKIHASDLAEFQSDVELAFERLAEKYYLTAGELPKVTVSRGSIKVTISFDKES